MGSRQRRIWWRLHRYPAALYPVAAGVVVAVFAAVLAGLCWWAVTAFQAQDWLAGCIATGLAAGVALGGREAAR